QDVCSAELAGLVARRHGLAESARVHSHVRRIPAGELLRASPCLMHSEVKRVLQTYQFLSDLTESIAPAFRLYHTETCRPRPDGDKEQRRRYRLQTLKLQRSRPLQQARVPSLPTSLPARNSLLGHPQLFRKILLGHP